MFGAVGEKLLLLCDMQPFSDPLEFTWEFLSVSTKKRQVLKTSTEFRNIETDKLSYIIKDEQAFGKVFCAAKTLDYQTSLDGKPCEFDIVPKGEFEDLWKLVKIRL